MEVISENFHKSRSKVLFFSCQVLELSGEATRRETQRISRLGGVTKNSGYLVFVRDYKEPL